MTYYIEKSYSAVRQALEDIRNRRLSAETTERMVKKDEIWLGYYYHALEIHGHRVDGNRVLQKLKWLRRLFGQDVDTRPKAEIAGGS